MDDIVIREARVDEAAWIVEMICRMVKEDMSPYSSHAPDAAESVPEQLILIITALIETNEALYLIAESPQLGRVGVVGAELEMLEGTFTTKKSLTISVVYVLPQFRYCGIATRLLRTMMSWGTAAGYEECNLSVAPGNPAKSLYEQQGFSIAELKMVRSLQPAAV